jgi:hypothetical protein
MGGYDFRLLKFENFKVKQRGKGGDEEDESILRGSI